MLVSQYLDAALALHFSDRCGTASPPPHFHPVRAHYPGEHGKTLQENERPIFDKKIGIARMLHKTLRSPLICFSHLRWNFVYQRPQHLMVRAAKHYDVTYFEEPIVDSAAA